MKTYLEPEEVAQMEKAAQYLRDRLLIRLLFRTGIRASEAVSLEEPHVDLERGEMRVVHLKERLRLYCPGCGSSLGRSHHFCPGCGQEVADAVKKAMEIRRIRILPLDSETVDMIRRYISLGGCVHRDDKAFLFGLRRSQIWLVVRECARRAGLAPLVHPESGKLHGVSPHRLRDAFAVHKDRAQSDKEISI